MPAATHTETLKCVNDALMESLTAANTSNGINGDYHFNYHYHRRNNSNTNNTINTADSTYNSSDEIDPKSIENKLYSNSKNILNTKIEFEEVDTYNKSILDEFKSKYLHLRSTKLTKMNNTSNGNDYHNHNGNIISLKSKQGKHTKVHIYLSLCLSLYIYIYIYISYNLTIRYQKVDDSNGGNN